WRRTLHFFLHWSWVTQSSTQQNHFLQQLRYSILPFLPDKLNTRMPKILRRLFGRHNLQGCADCHPNRRVQRKGQDCRRSMLLHLGNCCRRSIRQEERAARWILSMRSLQSSFTVELRLISLYPHHIAELRYKILEHLRKFQKPLFGFSRCGEKSVFIGIQLVQGILLDD